MNEEPVTTLQHDVLNGVFTSAQSHSLPSQMPHVLSCLCSVPLTSVPLCLCRILSEIAEIQVWAQNLDLDVLRELPPTLLRPVAFVANPLQKRNKGFEIREMCKGAFRCAHLSRHRKRKLGANQAVQAPRPASEHLLQPFGNGFGLLAHNFHLPRCLIRHSCVEIKALVEGTPCHA